MVSRSSHIPVVNRVAYINGMLLCVLGMAMTVPLVGDLVVGNRDWQVFAAVAAITLVVGTLLVIANRTGEVHFTRPEVFLVTLSMWLSVAIFAALPFLFALDEVSFTDAFFESVSGLTTTGATVLTGLDDMPPGILLWRGTLQWIGGIGIIVMAIVIFPILRLGGMQLFRTESSDRSDKVFPRVAQIAAAISLIYLVLTVLCAIVLGLDGMTAVESMVHAMTAVSTGGFSTSDGSIGHFHSKVIEWTMVVFMISGSLPFVFYIRTFSRGPRFSWRDSQVRRFLAALAIVCLGMTVWHASVHHVAISDALRQVTFSVVSIVTTTGYSVVDYSHWGNQAVLVFFLLTFVGGCSGSTAGGIKFYRLELFVALLWRSIRRNFMPNMVLPIRYNGKTVPEPLIGDVLLFLVVYLITVLVIALLLAFTGLDFVTSISGAVTAVSNVGPGLGDIIGPAGTFAPLGDFAKWLLVVGMLMGRLEIFTVLVLFSREFWREIL